MNTQLREPPISFATQFGEVGYECAMPQVETSLVQRLRSDMLCALSGERSSVYHVERRASGDLVMPCPVQEAVAEAMHLDCVGKALMSVLRFSHCEGVEALREEIASVYAREQARLISSCGGSV